MIIAATIGSRNQVAAIPSGSAGTNSGAGG
jgi:hypothetical protein